MPVACEPVNAKPATPECSTSRRPVSMPPQIANLREATELYLEEFPLKSSGQRLVTTFQVAVNA